MLADVGEVFLDVASDTKVVLWDAPGGLENDLELFFDVERVFANTFLMAIWLAFRRISFIVVRLRMGC